MTPLIDNVFRSTEDQFQFLAQQLLPCDPFAFDDEAEEDEED